MRVENEKGEVYHISWNMQTVVLDCTVGRCFPRGLFTQLDISFWEKKEEKKVQKPPILVFGGDF